MLARVPGAALVVALATLSACGGGDQAFADRSVKEILATAEESMDGLRSVHIDSNVIVGGWRPPEGAKPTSYGSLDIDLGSDGSCAGTVSLVAGRAQVVGMNGVTWIKPDEAFWRTEVSEDADAVMERVRDRWVEDRSGRFSTHCDLAGTVANLFADVVMIDLEKDGSSDIEGRKAIKLSGSEGSVHIAAEAPHVVLRVELAGGEPGVMDLSRFDEELDIEAPADDEIVDLTRR